VSAPKFGRNYLLGVALEDGSTLTIQPPFTIEFDITRNVLTSANVCQIRIYNLSAKNRDLIRFDFSNYGTLRQVALRAGYGTNLPIIFSGNISQAWSVREGINFITTIECFDGGFAFVNGVTPPETVFPEGTEMASVYTTLMNYLPGTTFGAIGPQFTTGADGAPITTTRDSSYSGNTADILSELSGNAFFIDNSKSYILGNSECLQGQVALINSQSGLLGTPLREDNIVTFDMLFEPGIIMGQFIELQSLTNPSLNSSNNTSPSNVNGFYKVVSIKHRGMISESVCGDAITTLEFFYGPKALKTVSSQ
jgi:hypothetical protein